MPAPRRCWVMPLLESRLYDAILFGVRTAASAMLALLVAFSLQLDQPGWAATSAVIVAQPVLGATLRKASLRLLGTVIGACAGILLFACFPQDRIGFLLGLAVWGGLCSVAGTLLGELLAYAPLLAGYTCAIVAMSAVTNPPDVFLLGIARAAAIAIGITSTTIVFSITDLGRQRRRLADAIAGAAGEAVGGLLASLRGETTDLTAHLAESQATRRRLVAKVASFDAMLDQAIGENIDLRSRAGVLRRAVAGLLVILSSWRGVEQHRRRATGTEPAVRVAEARLRLALAEAGTAPERLQEAARRIDQGGAADADERLLLDRVVHGLGGLAEAQVGLRLLLTPLLAPQQPGLRPTQVRHPYSAVWNGLRSLVTVAVAGTIWLTTGWDSGPTLVIFAMVNVVLFGTRDEAAYSGAALLSLSCVAALALGAGLKFAVMPVAQGIGFDGFGSLCLILGVPLASFGALAMMLPAGRPASGLAFMTLANLMPLLSPTNEITYDFASFMNGGLAILAGATLGAAAHRLCPPLPRTMRSWLLLRDARRDLRRIAAGAWRPDPEAWEARQYARLVGLPPGGSMTDIAKLVAALSVGRELLRRNDGEDTDPLRRQASEIEIAEAVASHPHFFRGLGLSELVQG